MFSIKSKSKRHCRRRRSTRHRRRMHNRKGGGKLEELQARLKALDDKAAKEPTTFGGTFEYVMERQDLLTEIATYDTAEVKASKAETRAKEREQSKKDSAEWLAKVAKLDDAQDQRSEAYLARWMESPPHGWRLRRPGETPGPKINKM